MNDVQRNVIAAAFLCIVSTSIFTFSVQQAEASDTSPVKATVKIGVCGNGIAEGSEDCDGEDARGKTCGSLGYTGGVLVCDIACDINISSCTSSTPTLTSDTNAKNTAPSPSQGITPLVSDSPLPDEPETSGREILDSSLPNSIQEFFLLNGISKITIADIPVVVKGWVDAWREVTKDANAQSLQDKCDVNADGSCDVKDFSVLMSYVQN